MGLNLVDALLLLVFLLALWGGWLRGFVVGALQVATLVASVAFAFIGYPHAAAWLEALFPKLGVWLPPIAFLACLLVAQLLLGAVAGRLLRSARGEVHRHGVNRLLGLLPGAFNGVVHACIVTLLLQALPLPPKFAADVHESAIARRLSGPVDWLEASLGRLFEPAIRRSLQALTVQPDSRTTVQLPFRSTDGVPRPELEARMLDMVNAERAREGLRPLQADPELTEVARRHSRDMLARGYFSHETLGGGSLSDRLRAGEVRYLLAGENLAFAPTLQRAHQGLMNSPGHRANILRPQYGRVGIGIIDAGRHGLMVTQNFRN